MNITPRKQLVHFIIIDLNYYYVGSPLERDLLMVALENIKRALKEILHFKTLLKNKQSTTYSVIFIHSWEVQV